MSESEGTGSRADFLDRITRFMDVTLDRLNEARKGKDPDEKEARSISNLALKVFRLWDKALQNVKPDSRLELELRETEDHSSGTREITV